MADNFCGVLIFFIFVIDLAVMKFVHLRKLMPTVIWLYLQVHDDGRGHKHHGSVANISHHHPADNILDTNILLSHAICPSLYRYGLVTDRE